MRARTVKPTVRPTMSPTGLICLAEDEYEADDDELGDEEGGREKMVEMVAMVVVVGEGRYVVGTTIVTVREVDRFVKDAAFVENGRAVGCGVAAGALDDVENPGRFSEGHAFGSPQGSTEQQPKKLPAAQA